MFKIKLVTPQIHSRSGERRESDTIEPGYGADNKPRSRFFFPDVFSFCFLESSILSGFKIKCVWVIKKTIMKSSSSDTFSGFKTIW